MRTRAHGFTLIEMLVAGTVLLLIASAAYAMLTRAWANQDMLLTQNMVQKHARTALDMVCDQIRFLDGNGTTGQWDAGMVAAYNDSYGAVFGLLHDQTGNPVISPKICRIGNGYLVRQITTGGKTTTAQSVAYVSRFSLVYHTRKPRSDGSILWTNIGKTEPPMNNWKANQDSRVNAVSSVDIAVETSAVSPLTGITYHSTLTTTVKVRNCFYILAPPT